MTAFAWFILLWQVGAQSGYELELMPAAECQVTLQQAARLIHDAKEQGIPVSHSAGCWPLEPGDDQVARR